MLSVEKEQDLKEGSWIFEIPQFQKKETPRGGQMEIPRAYEV